MLSYDGTFESLLVVLVALVRTKLVVARRIRRFCLLFPHNPKLRVSSESHHHDNSSPVNELELAEQVHRDQSRFILVQATRASAEVLFFCY